MSTNSFKTNPKRLVLNATLIITQQLFLYRPPSDYPVRGVAQKNRCSCSSSTVTLVHFALYYLWRKVFVMPVSYTHLRAHETRHDLVCRLLLEKKNKNQSQLSLISSV